MGKSIESVQKDDKICQNNGKVCQKILKPKIWVNQFKVCKKVIKYVKIYGQINSKCAKEWKNMLKCTTKSWFKLILSTQILKA